MNVATTIEADTKTPEVVESRVSAFYNPAEFAQTAAMFGATPCGHWPDTTITQALAMGVGVIAAITINDPGHAKWSAARAANRGDGVDQRQQLGDVVTVCAGQCDADRHSVGVYEDVVL